MEQGWDVIELGRGDAPRLRSLLGVFADAFDEAESFLRAQPDDAYLDGLLESSGFIAVAAESDGAVIGGLAAYVLPKYEQARTEIYIYDLAVAEPHRRQGIATALIERLRTIAVLRNAFVIYVQADVEDEAALRLYARFGEPREVRHFDIPPA